MEFSPPYQVAEIILTYKTPLKLSERPKVKTVEEAYKMMIRHWDENKIGFIEEVKVLLLNRCNRVLGIHDHSSGGVASATVDPKLVFAAAIKANASAFIIAHYAKHLVM